MNPHLPHPFLEIGDPGLGTGLGGMTSRGSTTLNQVAMTKAYLRGSRCGIEGCGKAREDEVHRAAE